ncbi:MAG: hypothetical protein ACFFDH_26125 [Promethearchaeota archaeon]
MNEEKFLNCFKQAADCYNNGSFQEALEILKNINAYNGSKKWIKLYHVRFNLLIASSLLNLGNVAEAIYASMTEFRNVPLSQEVLEKSRDLFTSTMIHDYINTNFIWYNPRKIYRKLINKIEDRFKRGQLLMVWYTLAKRPPIVYSPIKKDKSPDIYKQLEDYLRDQLKIALPDEKFPWWLDIGMVNQEKMMFVLKYFASIFQEFEYSLLVKIANKFLKHPYPNRIKSEVLRALQYVQSDILYDDEYSEELSQISKLLTEFEHLIPKQNGTIPVSRDEIYNILVKVSIKQEQIPFSGSCWGCDTDLIEGEVILDKYGALYCSEKCIIKECAYCELCNSCLPEALSSEIFHVCQDCFDYLESKGVDLSHRSELSGVELQDLSNRYFNEKN